MTVEKTYRLNDYRYINREGVPSMNRIYSNKAQGFTLVELLVVMLVLVALSSITLDFTKDFAFQGRYEVTKDRYDKIKRAIIGRPDVLINGQPDISGFVADMGRLPDNIRELFQSGYCVTAGGAAPTDLVAKFRPATCTGDWKWSTSECTDNIKTTEATCIGGHRWLGEKISLGLNYGWNGPYLTITKDVDETNAFVDGWGRVNDNLNYGWNYALSNTLLTGAITLQSLGKNQALAGTDTYDEDYPAVQPVITGNDWAVDIGALSVNIQTPFKVSNYCEVTNLATKNGCQAASQRWLEGNFCQDISMITAGTCSGSWDADYFACKQGGKILSTCTGTDDEWRSGEYCEETSKIDSTTCAAASLDWSAAFSICIDKAKTNSGTCTGGALAWKTSTCQKLNTSALCNSNWMNWDSSTSKCMSQSKSFCDEYIASSNFTSPNLCLKASYRSVDADGQTVLIALDSTSNHQVSEDGRSHLQVFNFYNDTNSDGDMDAGEQIFIPFGIVKVGLYEYDTGAATCTATKYNDPGSNRDDIEVTFFPNSSLPIINW